MFGYAKRLAKSAFGLGMAIGMMFNLSILPAVEGKTVAPPSAPVTAVAAAATAMPMDPGADLHAYWSTLYQAVYGVALTTDMPCFQLQEAVTDANWTKYQRGFNEAGTKFGVQLVYFKPVSAEAIATLPAQDQANITQAGLQCARVIGTLYGVDGSESYFTGMYVRLNAFDGTPVYHLVPIESAPKETIDALAQYNGFSATGQDPGNAMSTCVLLARGAYTDCCTLALLIQNDCIADADITVMEALAACALTSLVPLVGWAMTAVCFAIAWGVYWDKVDACNNALNTALAACMMAYTAALANCPH